MSRSSEKRWGSVANRIFIECLDFAALPQLQNGQFLHSPGERHREGAQEADFLCHCWAHRECVDGVGDDDFAAEPLAELLRAVAVMRHVGIHARIEPNIDLRTNTVVTYDAVSRVLGIVYAGPFIYE
jgi:hypothetical protein